TRSECPRGKRAADGRSERVQARSKWEKHGYREQRDKPEHADTDNPPFVSGHVASHSRGQGQGGGPNDRPRTRAIEILGNVLPHSPWDQRETVVRRRAERPECPASHPQNEIQASGGP